MNNISDNEESKPFFNGLHLKKVQIMQKTPMSEQANKKWRKHLQKFRKLVIKCIPPSPRYLPTLEVTNKEALAEWVFDEVGFGWFTLIGWRKRFRFNKKSKSVEWFKLAELKIKQPKSKFKKFDVEYINLVPIGRFKWFNTDVRGGSHLEKIKEKKQEIRNKIRERKKSKTHSLI